MADGSPDLALHQGATKQVKPFSAAVNAGSSSAQQAFLAGRERLRQAINDHGIIRAPQGSHELWPLEAGHDFYSGKKLNFYIWQFYLRRVMLMPEHLNFIARCFWAAYRQRYMARPFQISGVEQACMPILAAILLHAPGMGIPIHAFTVRKERKSFGLRNLIEGKPDPDLPCVFIDDLTSPTHATLWHWVRACAEARLKVYRAFAVVYKGKRTELKDIPTTLGNLGIDAIFTLEDFNMTFEEYHANKQRMGIK